MKTSYKLLIPTLVALAAFNLCASGQDAAKPEDATKTDERGNGKRWGGYEEFRQKMNERLKASLKLSDEEWNAIAPLVEKVQAKQRDVMYGRFGGGGGRPRGNESSAEAAARPGAAESTALRAALENEATTPDDLKAKLNAVRENRKKLTTELEALREDLRKVLTVRQEAVLVASGILE